jgi:hypothetical protein
MIRRLTVVIVAVLVVAGAAFAGDWFDMENCAMCKNMSPGLMKSMSWEQVDISNGIVCITNVDKGQIDAYRKAHEKMFETSKHLQQGEQLPLCGSCTALGMCLMKGPHQEYAETSTGDVWIFTSDNPELVAELQAWAKRNREEMAMMMESKSHEGHGH